MGKILEASHCHIEKLEDGLQIISQFFNNVIDITLPALQQDLVKAREEIVKLLN
jgi:hypothetical protein